MIPRTTTTERNVYREEIIINKSLPFIYLLIYLTTAYQSYWITSLLLLVNYSLKSDIVIVILITLLLQLYILIRGQ